MSTGFRDLLGIQREEAEDGHSVVVLDIGEQHLNPHGTLHGGALATLVDIACGEAAMAAGGEHPVTIEMKLTYLEPGRPDGGPVRARAQVRKKGKRITVIEAEVTQGDDVLVLALATFTP